MKKLKFLPLILMICLLLSLSAGPLALAAGPEISAPSAILLNRDTGEVLFEKDADREVYPASTTKIMTVLLAVEAIEAGDISLSDKVTGSSAITYDLSELGSTAGIQVGETLTLEDLLYCTMLSSANEACNIIAEHVSGIIYYFIQRMNERAAELGCTATNFVNTHGLQSSLHHTTARDYSLIALEASRHPLLMEICGTAQKVIPATNYAGERTLQNSNALLCEGGLYGSGYLYEGCSGMKTGHTSYANYCLVSTAERDGVSLLCLVFGSASSDGCFRDSAALLDWGFDNVRPGAAPAPLDFLASSAREPVSVKYVAGGGSLEADIVSEAAVVLNQKNGEVFFAKNMEQRVEPADLTKLMTALLAAEAIEAGDFSLGSEVSVREGALADLPDGSTRMLSAGETIPMESLLYCALLSGADDACNAIADYAGGSIDSFVRRMNVRAQELGCTDTNFANPSGVHDEAQYTTALDFSLIALEASRNDLLLRICGTKAAELPETNKSPARTLSNTNALLTEESPYGGGYVYDRATGLKTGYNDAAGYCLAASAKDGADGISLVSVVFGGQKTDAGLSSFTDTAALYDNIFENYCYQEVLKSTENIASVDIELGSDSDYVNLRPASSISLLLPKDYDRSAFQMELTVYALRDGKKPTAPISAGEVLGEVSVLRGDENFGTVKLVASTSVDLSRVQYLKSQLTATLHNRTFKLIFWSVFVLFAAYIAWVIVYRVKRVKHLLALRELENAKAQAARAAAVPPAPDIEFFPPERPAADALPTPPPSGENLTEFPAADAAAPVPDAAPAPEPPRQPPAAPKSPAPELSVLKDQSDRDYFEEFFRKK